MRIGIDNISPGEATSRHGPGGMRAYLRSLLTEFVARAPHHTYVLFTPTWADPLLDAPPANVKIVAMPSVPKSRLPRVFYQQTVLPAWLARQRLDVFFATATVAPLLCPAPVVLAVQFTQFYQWPEAYGRSRTSYLKTMLPLSLRKAQRAIIFTESAKQDLVRWTGVSAEKVSVIPHGLSPTISRLTMSQPLAQRQGIGKDLTGGRPYILYVSATYGYKNHARLVQAFGLLKQRLDVPHVLLLVGSEVTVSFAELRGIAERAGVADQVVFAGRIDSNEDVAALYLGADLVVIPTLYETFGFPVLEAMACGCPTVASNNGSTGELAKDAALLVDPSDVDAIADGMVQVLSDPVLRQRLVARGLERSRAYTWERSATQTLEILEQVARA